jgi:BirA family transcriptional regulator, biotin operon repressor / biotin---[acetyl-CoA-carboxylase] ligase
MNGDPGASRAPLSAATLSHELVQPGGLWRSIAVLASTGSTNADLLAQAAKGAPEGSVLAAEAQTAGRGRMGRSWLSPPGAALMFSVLLRPTAVPPSRRGWLPLLAGLAVASAVRGVTGLEAGLKWPNDVLIGGAKLAGILAEQSAGAIVVGIGLNVSTQRSELPVETATSLALAGATQLDRPALLRAVLGTFERRYLAWTSPPSPGDPDATPGQHGPGSAAPGVAAPGVAAPGVAAPGVAAPGVAAPGVAAPGVAAPGVAAPCAATPCAVSLRDEYRRYCVTLGRQVRVELPGGGTIEGTARDIDEAGRLLVGTPDGPRIVSAGDIVHLR